MINVKTIIQLSCRLNLKSTPTQQPESVVNKRMTQLKSF